MFRIQIEHSSESVPRAGIIDAVPAPPAACQAFASLPLRMQQSAPLSNQVSFRLSGLTRTHLMN